MWRRCWKAWKTRRTYECQDTDLQILELLTKQTWHLLSEVKMTYPDTLDFWSCTEAKHKCMCICKLLHTCAKRKKAVEVFFLNCVISSKQKAIYFMMLLRRELKYIFSFWTIVCLFNYFLGRKHVQIDPVLLFMFSVLIRILLLGG